MKKSSLKKTAFTVLKIIVVGLVGLALVLTMMPFGFLMEAP